MERLGTSYSNAYIRSSTIDIVTKAALTSSLVKVNLNFAAKSAATLRICSRNFLFDCLNMFGIKSRRPPAFGGVHPNDDKDIQVYKPADGAHGSLWGEARLLLRDLYLP